MLKLSVRRFSAVLFLQCILLLIDLGINSFSYLARGQRLYVILLFLTQDICLVLSFTAFLFNLYSTYVFQAGLAEILYNKFRFPLLILATYFILCVSHHIWIVYNYQKTTYIFQWPTTLTTLFIIQRLFSPLYYYSYKRSALKMSDPRFYENMDWVTDFLAIK